MYQLITCLSNVCLSPRDRCIFRKVTNFIEFINKCKEIFLGFNILISNDYELKFLTVIHNLLIFKC